MKHYRISMLKDILLNMISASSLTAMIQLVIFPIISRRVEITHFGIIIALYGFNNVIVNFLGNSLNNIRLINNSKTKEKGNFTFLLYIVLIMTLIVTLVLYFVYGNSLGKIEMIMAVLFTLLSTLRTYLLVFFRLKIKYNNILFTNLIIILGYVVGLIIYTWIPIWSIIFLMGELFGIAFLLLKTPFLKEKSKKDQDYNDLMRGYINLSSSNGISNVLNYLDRFFINPVLGSTNMSIYYSVSVISKFISMIIVPFNNVLLTYMNKMSPTNAKKNFMYTNIISIITLIPIYFLMNIISPYLIRFLYPSFASSALKYIWIVNLSTMFMLLSSILNPYILKFTNLKYQFNVQVSYGLIYISLAFILSNNYGLAGFCLATLISFIFKWLLVVLIGFKKIE